MVGDVSDYSGGVALVGWFPENGTTELLTTLTLVKFVQVGVVQALITFSSMLADIADEHELRRVSAKRVFSLPRFRFLTKSLQVLVRW